MNSTILSAPPQKGPRIETSLPEYGDARDVQLIFGIKETHLYALMKEGRIKAVLVKGRGRTRGKWLFDYRSIRRMLASLEAEKGSQNNEAA
jgi:Helix-turn-helix domain